LLAAGAGCGKNAAAEILGVERDQVRYRLTVNLASLGERGVLLRSALEALGALGATAAQRDALGAERSE
jgi:hypothetical protein